MKPLVRRILYPLGLAVGGLLFGIQIWTAVQALRDQTISLSNPYLLLWAWGANVLATAAQVAAWHVIMRTLNVEVAWLPLARGYVLPFLARYIPGNVWGYISRSEWMRSKYHVSHIQTNTGAALELVSLLTSAAVWLGLYLAVQEADEVDRLWLGALVVVIVPMSWVAVRLAPWRRVAARLMGGNIQLAAVAKFPFLPWVAVVALHGILWLCYGWGVVLTLRALTIDGQASLLVAVFFFAMAWWTGFFAIFVPSGLGVRELTFSNLLVSHFGLALGLANTVALLTRVAALLTEAFYVIILASVSLTTRLVRASTAISAAQARAGDAPEPPTIV